MALSKPATFLCKYSTSAVQLISTATVGQCFAGLRPGAKQSSAIRPTIRVSLRSLIEWSHLLTYVIEETQTLAAQLCNVLYQNNSALATSVAAAVAQATSLSTSTASKDPSQQANYPSCAVSSENLLCSRPYPLGNPRVADAVWLS